MGASVGRALVGVGAEAVWVGEGRSTQTRQRALAAGLRDAGTLARACGQSDVLLSICPPGAALDQARSVAAAGYRGLYVDANAISPSTTRAIGSLVTAAGSGFVDGGIVGPPARRAGSTRLYLSGARAAEVAAIFEGSLVDARVVSPEPGAASALKMCYAAYTKGAAALVLAVHTLARAEGVERALRAEWKLSQPDVPARAEATAGNTAPKAWRWVGEMAEIAATFEGAGLPDGFHVAAGALFERLTAFKDATGVTLEAVLATLASPTASAGPPQGHGRGDPGEA